MLDEIKKLCIMTKKVIDGGERSKTISEIKQVKNLQIVRIPRVF